MTPELENEDGGVRDGRRHIEGAAALAAAVVQIELAVREAQPPVERLTLLVDCIAETLRELRVVLPAPAPTDTDEGSPSTDEPESPLERLQKDLYLCVTQLQFYDRLVQHLGHVCDYLAGVANELASPVNSGDDTWDELRLKLRTRLISAAQRELLDSFLSPGAGSQMTSAAARAEYAASGSVELF